MFSKIWTKKSTAVCSTQIDKLRRALDEADTVIIGAGAGLSTSAGLNYAGERFKNIFLISQTNTVFRICIPAVFIRIRHRKNTGRIGAAISM